MKKINKVKKFLKIEFYEDMLVSVFRFFIKRSPTVFIGKNFNQKHPYIAASTSFCLILVILFSVIWWGFLKSEVEASWWDDDWYYRASIPVTNNTTVETDVYVSVTIDTSDTDKFQGDCGDLRFTKQLGSLLPYYISSGCGTSSTVVHVNLDSFPAGANTYYYYYGNPSADDGFEGADFSTEASDYTVGSLGSEEKSSAPVGYWALNEGYGTTTNDESSNVNNGTISGSTWKMEDMCVSGKCLNFDGSDDVITVTQDSAINLTSKTGYTISTWINADSDGENNTGEIIDKGSNTYLRVDNESGSNLDVEAKLDLATTDATLNISSAITTSSWNHIVLTYEDDSDDEISIYINGILKGTSTDGVGSPATDSNNLLIGGDTSNNFDGRIDEVKVYPYVRSAAEIKQDYNAGKLGMSVDHGVGVGGGEKSDQWLVDDLVGYWKLDETSGNASDSSGNGNDLTDVNTVTFSSGKFGRGGDFESGSSEYQYIADNADLSITGDLTISAWIKPESVTASTSFDIAGKWDSGDSSYLLQQYRDELVLYINSGSVYNLTSGVNLTTSTWYHVVGVYNSSDQTIKIYVNGEDVSGTTTGTVPSSIADSAGRFHIGAEDSSGTANNFYDGKIDEVRLYKKALSLKEVRELYNWAPEPIIKLDMDEKTGTTVYDTSENSYNGTMTNMDAATDWVRGKYGSGLDFDGSNDYINMAGFDPHVYGEFSISVWYKSTDTAVSDDEYIWAHIVPSTDVVSFGPTDDGGHTDQARFNIRKDGATQSTLYGTSDVVDQQWHHIVGVRNSSKLRLYIDGVLESEMDDGYAGQTISIDASGGPWIGDQPGSTEQVHGVLDNFRLYNYALSQRQVTEDMNAGHPIGGSPIGSQVGYWKFDEGYGTTANDSGIGENNGTISGASWDNDGKFGRALDLDGTNDVITITQDSSINLTDKEGYTISTWINADSDGENNTGEIIDKGSNTYLRVDNESGSNLDVEAKLDLATTDATLNISSAITTNSWNHIVLTYEDDSDDEISIYINGILKGTSTDGVGSPATDSNNLLIGGDTSNNFDGTVDEVKVYSSALSADEILIDYNQGKSLVLGSKGTESDGSTASFSASREYCVPGDTSTCNSPIIELKLDEKTGTTVYDTSENSYNGTMTNMDSATDWVRGRYGSGLDFDGSNDYIDMSAFDPYTYNNFTISAWYKSADNTVSNDEHIWAHSTSGGSADAVKMGLTNDGGHLDQFRLQIKSNGGTSANVYGISDAVDQQWHHLVAVRTSTKLKVYVDGAMEAEASDDYAGESIVIDTSGGPRIGISLSDAKPVHGAVDDFKLYDYARTPAQIAWDYNRGKPVGHWRFNENEGTTAHDESENTNDGTISGASWDNDGKFGRALDLDGTNDVITITQDSSINLTDKEGYTISTWINADSDGENNTGEIIDKGSNTYLRVDNESGSNLDVEAKLDLATTDATLNISSAITTNSWNHIVLTYEDDSDDEISIYINGILKGTSTDGVGSPATDSNNLLIGGDTSNNFDGTVDEVRVYNYNLTAEQIKQDYNKGKAVGFR